MIVEEIKEELRKNADQEYYNVVQRFTKEFTKSKITLYGIRTPIVRKIAAKYYSQIKMKPKEEIFSLCEDLLKFRNSEERTIAFDWAFRLRKHYIASDFYIFESWCENYVTGWGSCDDLCTRAFGAFIYQSSEFIPEIKKWAKSENRWMRRASAVVLIYSLRRKQLLDPAFETANILLRDKEDLVQKGYGWMLKEASKHYPEKVFNYVMKHKKVMPRTALRYAIEKMSPEWKKKAMARE